MDYEIVDLTEKTVVGISARTKNSDVNMTTIIGSLWSNFYQNGIYASIPNKVNTAALGIYSDYETDVNGTYQVTVGCEVSSIDNLPLNTMVKKIPAGKYAKFIVHGHMQQAVAAFWEELWQMNLDRNYQCDFEEYLNSDMENAVIHIYISIN